jgi:hypothetical protein
MELIAVLVLGLVSGLVLGYWSAMPRVRRLETESENLLDLVMDLAEDLMWELDLVEEWQSELGLGSEPEQEQFGS